MLRKSCYKFDDTLKDNQTVSYLPDLSENDLCGLPSKPSVPGEHFSCGNQHIVDLDTFQTTNNCTDWTYHKALQWKIYKMEDLYCILQCRETDSQEVLKHSYQNLIKELHPDKVNSSALTDCEKLEKKEEFLAVDRAWRILSDDHLRREYDVRWHERCLAQDYPIHEVVCLEDFDNDDENKMKVYSCRCGGDFKLSETDIRLRMDVVCCDSCSLSIRVNYDSDFGLT